MAGCLLLLRRDPRLFAATALIGLLPPVLFAQHATDHYYFWAYLGPLFAAGLATAAASRHTFVRWPGLALLLAATVVAWSTSYTGMRQHKTTLFHDLGAVLTAAADMPWPSYAERA